MSNVDKLAQAGVFDPNKLSADEKEVILSLTAEEVEVLLKVKSKLSKLHTGLLGEEKRFPDWII